MPAENFSDRERSNVAQRSRKDNEADEAVSIARVSQKSEMPEHPADINESDDGERHPLQFAAGAIAQNRNDQDQRDLEDRHRDKKTVPTGAWFFAARMRNYRRNSDSNDSGVNCAGHPPVAIQSGSARELLESVDRE